MNELSANTNTRCSGADRLDVEPNRAHVGVHEDFDEAVHDVVQEAVIAAFLAANGARLEARIEEVCDQLGQPIGMLQPVLARAVGTEGRGGSRWRPLLALAAAEVFADGRSRAHDTALDVAVAVELTHTASLVLDDMPCMDDSPERRGQPATHRLVGSAGAILLSVGLLAKSVELLGRCPEWGGDFCAKWGETVGLAGMSGGQAMDVAASTKTLLGHERRLHRAKSTLLPALALWGGARTAGAHVYVCDGLAAYGRSLGWAYQLRDDVEDLEDDARLGKKPGGRRPMAQSQRIMKRALRRLRELPGLSTEGADLLIGISRRLVVPDGSSHGSVLADGSLQ